VNPTPSSTTFGPLLSPDDLSDLLGLPTATLANWRSAGKGPPYLRLGRHVRYVQLEVDEWLAAQDRRP
jgi:predicted DNA-binding transcriptional regulator AlpA